MKVNFSFTQILPTNHPMFEIGLNFYGIAQLQYEGDIEHHCIIDSVFVKTYDQDYLQGKQLPITQIDRQNEATGEMAAFLGICREAARKEYNSLIKITE
jgi:hypothetical protein